ncbi:hypothetical protein ABW19_dt0206742 [Dactylella cylindrospora]|nr:hypothetical protein ABW19_dt0206742 [Dactylella cylindrospora]
MASLSDPTDSSSSEIPPNLLLNPRAHVLKSASAPLSTVPSTSSTILKSPKSPSEPLSPEEEKRLTDLTLSHKSTGNTHFTSSPPDYELAISFYRSALEACPVSLIEQAIILHANVAAAFIKLEKWKEAENAATESLKASGEDDEILRAKAARKRAKEQKGDQEKEQVGTTTSGEVLDGRIEELDDEEEENIEWGKNWKARLRRAKAREMQGTWQSMTDALEDYKILSTHSLRFQPIPNVDRKNIQSALTRIPPRIEDQKQKEVAEMMGKLRGLGDTILKPFGLSTNNFQMVKDEKSGGYSLNFQQSPGK